jgi:TetR/AcrR family transcriptional regulator, transcriptional repressor of bet genes
MLAESTQSRLRRDALLRAALGAISERGSLDVTMAQIAARAGVSSALAHHYFGGKEDLILAAMRRLLSAFAGGVVAELRGAKGPRARLTAILTASFAPDQFRQATIGAWLTFYAKALSTPDAAHLLSVYQRRLRSNLIHALRGLVAQERAVEVAESVGALIDGVYLRQALASGPADPQAAVALVERVIDLSLGEPAP